MRQILFLSFRRGLGQEKEKLRRKKVRFFLQHEDEVAPELMTQLEKIRKGPGKRWEGIGFGMDTLRAQE